MPQAKNDPDLTVQLRAACRALRIIDGRLDLDQYPEHAVISSLCDRAGEQLRGVANYVNANVDLINATRKMLDGGPLEPFFAAVAELDQRWPQI